MTHLGAQLVRFGRLFLYAFLPLALALDWQHLTRTALIAAIVAALETATRQYWRVEKSDRTT